MILLFPPHINPLLYGLQPRHVNAFGPFKGFPDPETQEAALRIVRFCKDRNKSWNPFTKQDIDAFCRVMEMKGEFSFASLPGTYVQLEGDTCILSHEFVAQCFKDAPESLLS